MPNPKKTQPLIAVVDSEPSVISLLSDVLDDEGYRMVSGGTVYDLCTCHPDLLILDISTERAVWTLLDGLRHNPVTATIPIIAASTDAAFLSTNAHQLGAYKCSILVKPFELDELLAKIEALIVPRLLEKEV